MPTIAKAIYDHIYGLHDHQRDIVEKYGTLRYFQFEDIWRLTTTDGEAYVHYQTLGLVYSNIEALMRDMAADVEAEGWQRAR